MTGPVLSSPLNFYHTQVQEVKGRMANVSRQQNTGAQYDRVTSMQGEGIYFPYENLVSTREKLEAFDSSNTIVERRLGFQHTFITKMQDFVTKIRGQLIQFDAATENVDIPGFAELQLRQVGLILNDNTFGYYEFGGASSDNAPIADIEKFIAASNVKSDGTADASYTRVIPDQSRTKIDLQRDVAVSIDASDPAFQHLIGALHLIKNLPAGGEGKDKALKMLETSWEKFSEMQVRVGFNERILADAKASVAYAKGENSIALQAYNSRVEDLVLANQENQRSLQAIFYSMRLANSVSLIDFLK